MKAKKRYCDECEHYTTKTERRGKFGYCARDDEDKDYWEEMCTRMYFEKEIEERIAGLNTLLADETITQDEYENFVLVMLLGQEKEWGIM